MTKYRENVDEDIMITIELKRGIVWGYSNTDERSNNQIALP